MHARFSTLGITNLAGESVCIVAQLNGISRDGIGIADPHTHMCPNFSSFGLNGAETQLYLLPS